MMSHVAASVQQIFDVYISGKYCPEKLRARKKAVKALKRNIVRERVQASLEHLK